MLVALMQDTPWGVPFESHFITKYAKKLGGKLELSDRGRFRRIVNKILNERPILQFQPEIDVDDLYDNLPNHHFSTVADAVCRMVRDCDGKPSWGD